MRSLTPFGWSKNLLGREDNDVFATMQHEVNRLFNEFGAMPSARLTNGEISPRVDVAETENALEVTAELPGLDEKDVEVVLYNDFLTIRGEKKAEKEEKKKDYHLVERTYGSFARSLRLPFQADPERIKADFVKGVLKVTVAKPPAVKEKTIKIPLRTAN